MRSCYSSRDSSLSRLSSGLLASYSQKDHPHVPDNLLSFLERLTTFPTEQAELNKWWVEELGARPPKPKSHKTGEYDEDDEEDEKGSDAEEDEDTVDDWRKFFDDQDKDQDASAEAKTASARLHKLTIHQSLHSLSSHRAVFTRTWLTLLPQLSKSDEESTKALVTRALNVMHRGVMPHLTRAVLVMDWVASCVDYGKISASVNVHACSHYMRRWHCRFVGPQCALHPDERVQPVCGHSSISGPYSYS